MKRYLLLTSLVLLLQHPIYSAPLDFDAALLQARTELETHIAGKKLRLSVTAFQTSQQKYQNQPEIGEYLSDRLSEQLVKSPSIRIYERAKLQNIMKEHELLLAGVINEDEVVRLGELAPIDALVFGTYLKLKDSVEISLRLVDVVTGEIAWSWSIQVILDNRLNSLFAGAVDSKPLSEEDRVIQIRNKLNQITTEKDSDFIVEHALQIPVFNAGGDIHKDIIVQFNELNIYSPRLAAFYYTNLSSIEKFSTDEVRTKALMMLHYQKMDGKLDAQDRALVLSILQRWDSHLWGSSFAEFLLARPVFGASEKELLQDVDGFLKLWKEGKMGVVTMDDLFMPLVQIYFHRANYKPVTNDRVAVAVMEKTYSYLSVKKKNNIGNSLEYLYRYCGDPGLKERILKLIIRNYNERDISLGIMYDFTGFAGKLEKAQEKPGDNPDYSGTHLPLLVKGCSKRIAEAYQKIEPNNKSTRQDWKNQLTRLGILQE